MRVAHRSSEGFVLVATLWVLAVLAVLAAYIDGVVAPEIERAAMIRRGLESELDRRSTEATLIYLFTTGRMSYRGLVLEEEQRFSDLLLEGEYLPDHGDGEIGMAGEVYHGLGTSRFSVQDEGGLVSVNAPESPLFAALLAQAGVAAPDIETVVARTGDYIDKDSDLGLNGAEHSDYRQAGAPPPANWIMSSPQELVKVLGVDELLSPAEWRRLWPLLTVRPVFGYNFNTMRPEVLAAVPGLDEQGARNVLEERAKRRIARLTQIAMLSGGHLVIEEMELRTLPSRFPRIAIWHEGSGSRILTGLALTPLGESAPWRKDYRYSESMSAGHDPGTSREAPLVAATALLQ